MTTSFGMSSVFFGGGGGKALNPREMVGLIVQRKRERYPKYGENE